jgi:DNA polymerase delta subunit 1
LGINDRFRLGLGKIRNRNCNLIEQKLSSSALGDNNFKLFDIDGVVCVDLLKVMQKDFKLDSYKLDNVAAIYIKENKDDLKPKEIFEKFKGTSADRCVIAKYCIQDCILVNKLLHKLKIIENNIGMGNVCLVPLNFLFRRGQGIKIFSLIANECMKRNYLIPVIKNYISDEDNTEGYEGAIVLEPKEGIYLDDPIVVFDYGSLYPSSMICRNLSHDTYIMDDKYRDIKDDNVEIIKVSYDLYEGIGDKKVKNMTPEEK